MRFYNLVLTDPDSGQVWTPNSTTGALSKGSGPSTFTSFVHGQTIPGALNVEFDLPVTPWHTPQGGSIIRVWGVGLQMIGQAANLNGSNFQLYAGMQKGLPLANPAQAGLIAQGSVYQAFGNWQGPNQTLDLICNPSGIAPTNGISWQWSPGQTLATALQVTLTQAFPTYKQNINISSSLQPPNGAVQSGSYDTLDAFAQYLNELTQDLGAQVTGNPDYSGVQIAIDGMTIQVYDDTAPQKTVQLDFQDLIGQPTWIGPATITFKTVLRADINVGDQIKFPTGVVLPYALTSSAAAAPGAPARAKSVFQGTFVVNEVHHYANFRQPDADSWNTTFTAVPNTPAAQAA